MKIRSVVVAGAMTMAGLAAPMTAAHAEPDVEAPALTATYKVSAPSVYLIPDTSATGRSASVILTQTSAVDREVTRTVATGAGTTVTWPAGASTVKLTYGKAGVFTPTISLSRGAETGTVKAPSVTVQFDTVDPRIKFTVPSRAAKKAASWKVLRGTATDVGTGVAIIGVMAFQKRGKVWWSYDFAKKKWLKGYTKLEKTSNRSKATPALVTAPRGTWKTPAIKGLKAGQSAFQAIALDLETNLGATQVGPRRLR